MNLPQEKFNSGANKDLRTKIDFAENTFVDWKHLYVETSSVQIYTGMYGMYICLMCRRI